MTIAEAILRNVNLDVVQEFKELPSGPAKLEVVGQLIKLCPKVQAPLDKHRWMVGLARLLDELVASGLAPDSPGFGQLVTRCLDARLLPNFHPRSANLAKLARQLSAALRAEAKQHLREAIAEHIPDPRLDGIPRTVWSCKKTSVRVTLPVRLDLGMGGISDIPPYCMERPGKCVGVPVRLGNKDPLEATADVLPERVLQFVSKDHKCEETRRDISEFSHDSPYLSIHRGVLAFFSSQILNHKSIDDLYSILNGGLRLTTRSALPVGSGLGVSSLLPCALLKTLAGLLGIPLTQDMFVAASVYLENVIGVGGGWEDATALHPGVKVLISSPSNPFLPRIERLSVREETLKALRDRLLLVSMEIPKTDQTFFDGIMERYCLKDGRVLSASDRIHALNTELSEALVAGDLTSIGKAMGSQWESWKILTDGKCTNSVIEGLFAEAAPFVYGSRMNGAGGGGCAMFMVREGRKDEASRAIRSALGKRATFYDWEPVCADTPTE
jgi:galactokinase/mevalonate kinase-like predicted kinase